MWFQVSFQSRESILLRECFSGKIPNIFSAFTLEVVTTDCKGKNSAETRCHDFLVLEYRCRGFLVMESQCRGSELSEKNDLGPLWSLILDVVTLRLPKNVFGSRCFGFIVSVSRCGGYMRGRGSLVL